MVDLMADSKVVQSDDYLDDSWDDSLVVQLAVRLAGYLVEQTAY